jgi:hypothetical protein
MTQRLIDNSLTEKVNLAQVGFFRIGNILVGILTG